LSVVITIMWVLSLLELTTFKASLMPNLDRISEVVSPGFTLKIFILERDWLLSSNGLDDSARLDKGAAIKKKLIMKMKSGMAFKANFLRA
jgi:hypothetical protein